MQEIHIVMENNLLAYGKNNILIKIKEIYEKKYL